LLFVKGAEQRRQIGMDNDEELLQFAVRQSLLETGAEEDQVSCYHFKIYNTTVGQQYPINKGTLLFKKPIINLDSYSSFKLFKSFVCKLNLNHIII